MCVGGGGGGGGGIIFGRERRIYLDIKSINLKILADLQGVNA